MNVLRSMLFVPGDSERKLVKGGSSKADALILDLEDSVPQDRITLARSLVLEYLSAHHDRARQQLWVRVNPLSTPKALPDLAAIVAGAPDGILLPKTESAADAVLAGHYLTALETREGVEVGAIKILPVATETPAAMFTLGGYAGSTPRLWGMTWGAEDLPAAVGASTNRDPNGDLDFPYKLARALCLMAATSAGVQPIDTVYTDFRDPEGLRRESEQARRSGFTGKIAIHPDQVDVINAAFTPAADEVAYAKRVVEAFSKGAGTIGLDGKMLDMPHLKQARRVLEIAARLGG
ncbi:MAG TPA: CoA ester lyase [Candidatus Binataceae bacterium]|jgi:citrate lyase subunit beta/citryl-CoA lyase